MGYELQFDFTKITDLNLSQLAILFQHHFLAKKDLSEAEAFSVLPNAMLWLLSRKNSNLNTFYFSNDNKSFELKNNSQAINECKAFLTHMNRDIGPYLAAYFEWLLLCYTIKLDTQATFAAEFKRQLTNLKKLIPAEYRTKAIIYALLKPYFMHLARSRKDLWAQIYLKDVNFGDEILSIFTPAQYLAVFEAFSAYFFHDGMCQLTINDKLTEIRDAFKHITDSKAQALFIETVIKNEKFINSFAEADKRYEYKPNVLYFLASIIKFNTGGEAKAAELIDTILAGNKRYKAVMHALNALGYQNYQKVIDSLNSEFKDAEEALSWLWVLQTKACNYNDPFRKGKTQGVCPLITFLCECGVDLKKVNVNDTSIAALLFDEKAKVPEKLRNAVPLIALASLDKKLPIVQTKTATSREAVLKVVDDTSYKYSTRLMHLPVFATVIGAILAIFALFLLLPPGGAIAVSTTVAWGIVGGGALLCLSGLASLYPLFKLSNWAAKAIKHRKELADPPLTEEQGNKKIHFASKKHLAQQNPVFFPENILVDAAKSTTLGYEGDTPTGDRSPRSGESDSDILRKQGFAPPPGSAGTPGNNKSWVAPTNTPYG